MRCVAADRERAETIRYAASEVVKDILPVLDNLERAVEAAETTSADSESRLHEGVAIVYKQFRDILSKKGLTEVAAYHEPFDPHIHEAVSRVESSEHAEGTVVEVLQKGYLFKDRLLRPSMVSVAQASGDGGGKRSDGDRDQEDAAVKQEE